MRPLFEKFRQGIPDHFLVVLAVGIGFAAFLTIDQMYWWKLKPDYAFGWLVPLFVAYIVFDRWPRIRALFQAGAGPASPRWFDRAGSVMAAVALAGGAAVFLLAALYRAGMGSTQPGSLALAAGFAGMFLGMIYFNVPPGPTGPGPWSVRQDPRIQAVGLFAFPALIWLLSAPLVSAMENAISLALLRQVVTVVFTVFNLLGYPLVQEGNVLLLPRGSVGVADACSGIRSLTGCLFAGSFLAAIFLRQTWQKFLLVGLAMGFAFFTNLLRSLFLTGWAYTYGSEAIEGDLHDATGFAVLGLTVAGLLALLPLFNETNWRRWLGDGAVVTAPRQAGPVTET